MINIVEKLKECPKGTKLYSPMVGDVYLKEIVRKYANFPIKCYNNIFEQISFTKEGKYFNQPDSECMLFPSKEQRDWNKFEVSYQFKRGDIIYNKKYDFISIYGENQKRFDASYYCKEKLFYNADNVDISYVRINILNYRIATPTEKELFLNKLKEAGYFWNSETNSLKELIIPTFKVGDKICKKNAKHGWVKIAIITATCYIDEHCAFNIPIEKQDEWELYVDKFDPTTLIPFESKVLVRNLDGKWKPAIFAGYDSEHNNYYTIGAIPWPCCIPYEENKHLLFTYEDCDDYYKN